ncbi:ankyrin repeat-containing domain protein [Armillaria novae-zelandiae]|uniref:Ankyrin repeat-containing domain protein n=1 Tax=Armillaria novae-zelandiae TaxID=153914 RepID=A0AA39NRX2_9AGAR|nr:ankyrin repeat-containing domain protein [Armillaria novae-zelandiae]
MTDTSRLFSSLSIEERNGIESNASYLPSDTEDFSTRTSILSPHADISTRPTTYDQLIDYLDMLKVAVLDGGNLLLGKKIGLGASFHVQEGRFLDRSTYSSFVAVKTPRESIHKHPHILSSIIREVLDEIRVMSHLSLHPNVANILGVVLEESGSERLLPRIVMERSVGSLGSLLRKSQGGLPRHLKTRFCLDVAAGLEALHLIEIVHADIKSDNILIFYTTENWLSTCVPMLTAKVSDFGFCVPDTTARDTAIGARGTVRFKAPETLYEAPLSLRQYANLPQRDIYSYGVMVWEVVNDGRLPFSTVSDTDVPSLQLSTEDGASDSLMKISVVEAGGFMKTIRGTVRRSPSARMSWQDVFTTLLTACDTSSISPSPSVSIVKYFTDINERQIQAYWNEFQLVGWIPRVPFLSTTWQHDDDKSYSKLVLHELEESARNRPWDWISAIRLALHHFQAKNILVMKEFLHIFETNRVSALGEEGGALLHLAVEADAVDVIRALLQKKANVGALEKYGRTPLHMVKSVAAAQVLIDFGANVQARRHGVPEGYTPLHIAPSGEVAELLIQNGTPVYVTYNDLDTPLHTADSADVVRVLGKYDADPLARDGGGRVPLHCAFIDEVAMSLMDLCPAAVRCIDSLGQTPLHSQIDNWNDKTVQRALDYGADVTAINKRGMTAHFGAAAFAKTNYTGYRVLFDAIVDTSRLIPPAEELKPITPPLHDITEPKLMELFLRNGFTSYINYGGPPYGYTALHMVADRDMALFRAFSRWLTSQKPLRHRLWKRPISPLSKDEHLMKYAPLVPSVELIDVLLKYGGDPNVLDKRQASPLHQVAQNAFGDAGHEVNVALVQRLVGAGGDVNARNVDGETPLHLASRVETVIALLKAGANPRIVDNVGVTPLHHVYRLSESFDVAVRTLIEHGADINAADDEGFNPLHYACRTYEENSRGFRQLKRWRNEPFNKVWQSSTPAKFRLTFDNAAEAVKALLDNGADADARTKAGETALDMLSRQPFGRDAYSELMARGGAKASSQVAPWWNF